MKARPIAEYNARGLSTPAQKFLAAAKALKGGTLPNPSSTVIKPGTALVPAVIGTGTAAAPQFPAKAATLPIKSPIVNPLPQWIGCVSTETMPGTTIEHVVMYLPYSPAAIALGAELDVRQIQEVTSPNFDLGAFVQLGVAPTPASEAALLVNGLPATLEQVAYTNALLLPVVGTNVNKVSESTYTALGTTRAIPAIKIDVYVDPSNFDFAFSRD